MLGGTRTGQDDAGRRPCPIRLLTVAGTRPEAIKIAPLAIAARLRPRFSHHILATGQHDALFDVALADFGLAAAARLAAVLRDPDPDIMVRRLAAAIAPQLAAARPDMVLVQGDTSSAYAAALAADGQDIPVGHVEAGLRSFDFTRPWPEERNRVAIDRIATLLFAPTPESAANLAHDPEATGDVLITGNTGIDALLLMRDRLPAPPRPARDTPALILLTCHRRESIGAGIEGICAAVLRIAAREDVMILCPVHANPAIGETVRARLGGHPRITLTGALSYRDAVAAMASARLILTDSGGIQEEAPALGTPALVLREVTERPEGLASGNLALVGTDPDRVAAAAIRLLDDPRAHARMARPAFPFGDGRAAEKILDGIEQYFSSVRLPSPSLRFAPISIMDAGREGA
ncbi:MAG TPA: UDP-N-acetylglucosamine 2-epimerase (non-hydrolyzing) [Sphingomonas sp.]